MSSSRNPDTVSKEAGVEFAKSREKAADAANHAMIAAENLDPDIASLSLRESREAASHVRRAAWLKTQAIVLAMYESGKAILKGNSVYFIIETQEDYDYLMSFGPENFQILPPITTEDQVDEEIALIQKATNDKAVLATAFKKLAALEGTDFLNVEINKVEDLLSHMSKNATSEVNRILNSINSTINDVLGTVNVALVLTITEVELDCIKLIPHLFRKHVVRIIKSRWIVAIKSLQHIGGQYADFIAAFLKVCTITD